MKRSEPPPLSLAYHGVANVRASTHASGLFVRPLDLERQIKALRSWGYRLLTFGEQVKLARHGGARSTASLTFDDGLADGFETLLPLLSRLSAPATLFIVTGWLGGSHPHTGTRVLSIPELRELHAAGLEIGGHTVTHPDLTTLPPSRATAELADCRRDLAEIIDAEVDVAAYPFGAWDPAVQEACRSAGYAGAGSGHDGSWSDPFAAPRQQMNYAGGLLGLRLKRRGRYEPLMAHIPAKLARRTVRRGREAIRVVSRDHL